MNIEIITPTASLYSGTVKQVKVPGSSGSFEMLENHAPIISTLQKGSVVILDDKGLEHEFEITGGVVEQSHNKVIVLVE